MTFEEKSLIYRSLVALVKADYPFHQAHQDRATQFLESLEPKCGDTQYSNQLVTDLVHSSAGPPCGFLDSILTLVSSRHSTIVAAAFSFLRSSTRAASPAIRDGLVESDLVSKVLATVQPHTLQISGNEKRIVPCVLLAFPSSLMNVADISTINKFNHRETILQKVVLPSSEFVKFLISNRHILSGDLFPYFMSLLCTHIRICPFHQPTLEFVLTSPIVMAFSSCFSIVEGDYDLWNIHVSIEQSLKEWKEEGPEVVQSGKRMIQALFSEGFDDTLEQMIKKKDGYYGSKIVEYIHWITQFLGLNVKWQ
ncbi:hypothetical protein BLNAU_5032 [Blattamonas nauphoetae]|uniref:Uncharacterized protein n=1 Tax=Blattamonas nauphoetae TaxID=2049346 RepID=A0ABQ9Y8Y1_9EUKA|nr:hypothetical protein BLNAU_5032 [Blattamonas nauphoetae]